MPSPVPTSDTLAAGRVQPRGVPRARGRIETATTRCATVAMGTVVSLRAGGGAVTEGAQAAIAEVERLERRWSRFRAGSDVSRLNAAAGAWVPVDVETQELLSLALRMRAVTGGAFDVTAGSPPGGRLEPGEDGRFRLRGGARLDLGGLGKGAAAKRALALLRCWGATSAVISLGQSSVGLHGQPAGGGAWRVGLRHPGGGPTQIRATLEIPAGFVSTSGEAAGAGGGKIIDPRTGDPVESRVRSVTVLSSDGAWAEAWSTALMVLGVRDGLACYARQGGFEAVFQTVGGELIATAGIARAVRDPVEVGGDGHVGECDGEGGLSGDPECDGE